MCIKIDGVNDPLIIEDPEVRQQQLVVQQRLRLNLLEQQQQLLQQQRETLQQQDMLQQQLIEVMQQQENLLQLSTIPFALPWMDSQFDISGENQSTTSQIPETSTASQVPLAQDTTLPEEYMDHDQQESSTHDSQNQSMLSISKPIVIWSGVLEWLEHRQNTNSSQQQTVQAPFQVKTNLKNGEPYVSGVSWPEKLIMRCFPSYLIHKMGQAYLNNSKFVLFNPFVCEATKSLIKFLSKGYVGYVHFAATSNNCNIKMLVLLYSVTKQTFIGFIPNNQPVFVNQLRKVVRREKILTLMIRQGPRTSRPSRLDDESSNNDTNVMPSRVSNTETSQNRILTSQTNTVTVDNSLITQNNNQEVGFSIMEESPQRNINIEDVEIFNQQRQIDVTVRQQIYEDARQHNLNRISELQQRIELLQQQEADIQRYLDSQGLEMEYQLEEMEDTEDSDSDSE